LGLGHRNLIIAARFSEGQDCQQEFWCGGTRASRKRRRSIALLTQPESSVRLSLAELRPSLASGAESTAAVTLTVETPCRPRMGRLADRERAIGGGEPAMTPERGLRKPDSVLAVPGIVPVGV
jgi:hypothetical protein